MQALQKQIEHIQKNAAVDDVVRGKQKSRQGNLWLWTFRYMSHQLLLFCPPPLSLSFSLIVCVVTGHKYDLPANLLTIFIIIDGNRFDAASNLHPTSAPGLAYWSKSTSSALGKQSIYVKLWLRDFFSSAGVPRSMPISDHIIDQIIFNLVRMRTKNLSYRRWWRSGILISHRTQEPFTSGFIPLIRRFIFLY